MFSIIAINAILIIGDISYDSKPRDTIDKTLLIRLEVIDHLSLSFQEIQTDVYALSLNLAYSGKSLVHRNDWVLSITANLATIEQSLQVLKRQDESSNDALSLTANSQAIAVA